MRRLSLSLAIVCVLGLAFGWIGCTDEGPTQSSALTAPGPDARSSPAGPAQVDPESFSCEDLEEARVRFGSPGFIQFDSVAVYAGFFGAPPGDKFLRIWWDYGRDREAFQVVDTQAGEPRRDDDAIYDIEVVVEHRYDGLSGPTDVTVRVELILEGGTRG